MSAPELRSGDCIHVAVPTSADWMATARSYAASYARVGVRIFMIDHVPGLPAPVVVSVVRGVPENITFQV